MRLSVLKPQFWLICLSFVLLMVAGCGFSLTRIDDKKEEDPITVIRRELRQMKADHRVAIFDLQKEYQEAVSAMQIELTRLGNANESVGQNLIQHRRDLAEMRASAAQKSADTEEHFVEVEHQHRLIHGRIEEESNRFKELSERVSAYTLKELESIRKEMAAQDAFQKKNQQSLQEQLARFEEKEGQMSASLRGQVELVQTKSTGLEKRVDERTKELQAVSEQVSQLIDKVLPAVNGLAARLDDLEWQMKKLGNGTDAQALNKRLSEVSEAVNAQRKSLEMLGNTLTSQVDKQQGLLQKTINRLDGLQAKMPTKDK